MAYYLATNRGAPFHFGNPTDSDIAARAYANRNRELFRTHPGHRCTDLQAQTEEDERLLHEQLESIALRLNEHLHREDNEQ